MAIEIIKGDSSKDIKSGGELALRISRFDSYRLFTLYENVRERKLMDVSGNQKYYLVFRSSNKEVRIPEYEPNGFFEVDKVNGCILFKITKKNADDILSMSSSGEGIFHIIRVYEEVDIFGNVLNVTDEVEVYNGRWGDDEAFNVFSTENKVDLLTKALAAQIDKNAKLLAEYNDLLEKYNEEVKKTSDLEKELELMRAERDALQEQINEYLGDTHDGTVLSTDTKYIAFENTLDNITFTEEQLSGAITDLMTKGEVDLSNIDADEPRVKLIAKVYDDIKDLKIIAYKNDVSIGSAVYGKDLDIGKDLDADDGDEFKFVCKGVTSQIKKNLCLVYSPSDTRFNDAVVIKNHKIEVSKNGENTVVCTIKYGKIVDVVGNIGTITCYIQ